MTPNAWPWLWPVFFYLVGSFPTGYLIGKSLHQLPFMRNHRPAWPAPGRPNVEHDHFAFESAQLHFLVVEILERHFGNWLADAEVAKLE